jgi:glycosyltransferase involved in cell wall biosynthesis
VVSEPALPGAPAPSRVRDPSAPGHRAGDADLIAGRTLRRPRPIILALVGFYPPAFLAGGPTRSVPRILARLGDELDFRVLTRDRDLGVPGPLSGVVPDRWVYRDGGRCMYLSRRHRLAAGLASAIGRTRHDVLYVNSVFAVEFSLIPLLLRRAAILPRRGLLIAPRGELDADALAIKRTRKRLYLWIVRLLRLVDDAIWHAATEEEATAIRRRFGTQARVMIARDIPGASIATGDPPVKARNALRVAFLGRISRMKNLDFAIAVLTGVGGSVEFDVYGPIEDRQYWEQCQALMRTLPPNIRSIYRGIVEPEMVGDVLGGHHLLFLPSRAESFGHAIVEGLAAGCPVLTSDRTPWHGLTARQAGWDLPLSESDRFREVIERCVAMSQEEFDEWSQGARSLAREITTDVRLDGAYRHLFRAALGADRERDDAAPGGTTPDRVGG